jgi:dipeptidase E
VSKHATTSWPRLLLCSSSVLDGQIGTLQRLLPRARGTRRLGHLVTAAVAEAHHEHLDGEERTLRDHGYQVERLDVADRAGAELAVRLRSVDILYVQGGNTFHLMHHLRQSGADRLIRARVAAGTVYVGVSAGSIAAGADVSIVGWSPAWDRNEVGLTDMTGLGLVPFAISPHYVDRDGELIAAHLPLPYPILTLPDGTAWMVNGDGQHLIGRDGCSCRR